MTQPTDPIHIVQEVYHFLDTNNRHDTTEHIDNDLGYFVDKAQAQRCVDERNQALRTRYDEAMDAEKKNLDTQIRKAENHNRRAAILRAAGETDEDVLVPDAFAPMEFTRWVERLDSYTTWEVLTLSPEDWSRTGPLDDEDRAERSIIDYRGPLSTLLELVLSLWDTDYGTLTDVTDEDGTRRVTLVTGGWSYNETILGAVQRTMLWTLAWQKLERGGRADLVLNPTVAQFVIQSS